jgi:hypothetical protein
MLVMALEHMKTLTGDDIHRNQLVVNQRAMLATVSISWHHACELLLQPTFRDEKYIKAEFFEFLGNVIDSIEINAMDQNTITRLGNAEIELIQVVRDGQLLAKFHNWHGLQKQIRRYCLIDVFDTTKLPNQPSQAPTQEKSQSAAQPEQPHQPPQTPQSPAC